MVDQLINRLSVWSPIPYPVSVRFQGAARVTFATTTSGLLALADWLESFGVEHVAMEATGVYWKPVWHILEGHVELVLANAAHVKNVPGRKTDVKDAEWIAELLAHGLLRPKCLQAALAAFGP